MIGASRVIGLGFGALNVCIFGGLRMWVTSTPISLRGNNVGMPANTPNC